MKLHDSDRGQNYRLGFDIGGTFTDFVLLDHISGSIQVHKRLTTADEPSVGALAGIAELLERESVQLHALRTIVHGTTLVTNAIIERRGARVGLLTTRGFRDILAMGKEQRYDVQDLFLQFPEPLVPRRWRREIDERMDRDGRIVRPLDSEQVLATVRELQSEGVESIAVCFLHSYKNDEHERRVKDLIRDCFPGLFVSISTDVVPEIREYERVATCTANGFVKPLVNHYLERLEHDLSEAGWHGSLFLMQSSGGTAAPSTCKEYPIRLLESGPAAGALASSFYGRLSGRTHVLSFDMGGTTAKACVVRDGAPSVAPALEVARVHRFRAGSGIPVKTPVIDLIEIGAGGGSLARRNELGLLEVGPESAGASPGPACYGLGGTEPTVTDANLFLGYLNHGYFLGGRMSLDPEAAVSAIESLALQLGMSELHVAWGIHSLVNENMAAAASIHIVEKGEDPRRFSMVAFGGAGPAHACRVARLMGLREVISPLAAGATSALGFLIAPISFDLSHSLPVRLGAETDWAAVERLLTEMETKGQSMLDAAGVDPAEVQLIRFADMRYVGQMHQITVQLPPGELNADGLPRLEAGFRQQYRKLYQLSLEGHEIEVLGWRVQASGQQPQFVLRRYEVCPGDGKQAIKGTRRAYFPESGGFLPCTVYDRYGLQAGDQFAGPAIVEEAESTAVIGPHDQVSVDEYLNLVIQLGQATPNRGTPS